MTVLAQTGVVSHALQWGKYGTGTVAAAKSISKVVASANPANNETFTIGSHTYTFKGTLSGAADEVKIGASATVTMVNLALAINAGSGAGTLYGTGTIANTDVTAVAAYQTVFLTAVTAGKAGNTLSLHEKSAGLSVPSAVNATATITFSGLPSVDDTVTINGQAYTFKASVTTTAYQVKIGLSATAAASNLAAAIVAGAGSGTVYGSLTTVNADVTASAALGVVTLTALASGTSGNSLTLAISAANTTISGATLASGLEGHPTGGADAGSFDITALSYARYRASDIDYDAVQDSRVFPLEVGSVTTPTGAYKAGAFAGGGATLFPRLQDTFGELLLGLLGSAGVQANTPVSGAYTHTFQFDPNALEEIPWFTVRKDIPGRGSIRPEGVVGVDNKLAQMRIAIPQNDIVSARVDFAGRIPQFDNYADAWLYANAYENADKAAYSCLGSFKIPSLQSTALPVTSVIVEMVNVLTTPREEMIVGSYNPDDYVVRTRMMRVRFVYKWADPTLYQKVFTGSANGTTWSPVPFTTAYDGTNYAFEAIVQSVSNITGSTPYSLKIRAGTVVWEPVGPIRLQGGGILSQEYMGTVIEPDAALNVPYCEIQLVNGRSTVYSVPTQP